MEKPTEQELARSRAMRLRQLAEKAKRAWDRACREAAKADYTPATVAKMERARKDMMALEAGAKAIETLATINQEALAALLKFAREAAEQGPADFHSDAAPSYNQFVKLALALVGETPKGW